MGAVAEEAKREDARLSSKLPLKNDKDDNECAERDEDSDDDGVAPGAAKREHGVSGGIHESERATASVRGDVLLVAAPLERKQ